MVCHSLLQWTTFCQTSPPWPVRLGWSHTAWLSFIELDKTVVHVIRLASFLRICFQSVCPLMPSLSAYCLIWVSLNLEMGYLFRAAPAKRIPTPYFGRGLSPHGLGRGVYPLSRWPLQSPFYFRICKFPEGVLACTVFGFISKNYPFFQDHDPSNSDWHRISGMRSKILSLFYTTIGSQWINGFAISYTETNQKYKPRVFIK